MKCYVCNGTGKRFVPTNKNAITGNGYTADCLICNGTGKLALTNEKWLCSLPTDKKALIIAELSSYGGNVYALEKWLKEVHDA